MDRYQYEFFLFLKEETIHFHCFNIRVSIALRLLKLFRAKQRKLSTRLDCEEFVLQHSLFFSKIFSWYQRRNIS